MNFVASVSGQQNETGGTQRNTLYVLDSQDRIGENVRPCRHDDFTKKEPERNKKHFLDMTLEFLFIFGGKKSRFGSAMLSANELASE